MITTGSTTHAQPSESKFFELDFNLISDGKISFNISDDKNYVQNGSYMIFALDKNNITSNGKVVILK